MHIVGDLKFGDHKIIDTVTSLFEDDTVEQLVLNLSGMAKLDSYGIGILLKANKLAEERGKSMAVCGLSGGVAEIFAIFNLSEALTVLESST